MLALAHFVAAVLEDEQSSKLANTQRTIRNCIRECLLKPSSSVFPVSLSRPVRRTLARPGFKSSVMTKRDGRRVGRVLGAGDALDRTPYGEGQESGSTNLNCLR